MSTIERRSLGGALARRRRLPIPGTKRRRYLEENVGALDVRLTDDELRQLDEAFPSGVAAGDRYPDMSTVNR